MSREYKGLVIPDRHLRTNSDIIDKQHNYCKKSECVLNGGSLTCDECLFQEENIKLFEEWYMSKNKTKVEE